MLFFITNTLQLCNLFSLFILLSVSLYELYMTTSDNPLCLLSLKTFSGDHKQCAKKLNPHVHISMCTFRHALRCKCTYACKHTLQLQCRSSLCTFGFAAVGAEISECTSERALLASLLFIHPHTREKVTI